MTVQAHALHVGPGFNSRHLHQFHSITFILQCIDNVITTIYTASMTTTIQVRADAKVKKSAQLILGKLGLDLSTAINIYLVQIVEKQGIPFQILTENGMTPAQEKKILKEIDWAMKHGKRYSSAKEMHEDILRK